MILVVWTQALLLDELAKAEPKRLRYRLLHVAGRPVFWGRRARLRLQRTWPRAREPPPPSVARFVMVDDASHWSTTPRMRVRRGRAAWAASPLFVSSP
jgi:hypothetical protein